MSANAPHLSIQRTPAVGRVNRGERAPRRTRRFPVKTYALRSTATSRLPRGPTSARPTRRSARRPEQAGVLKGGEGLQPDERPRPPFACATASACSPTARSPRPRGSSAATTWSRARTSTGDRVGGQDPRRRPAASRCARSWTTRRRGPRRGRQRGRLGLTARRPRSPTACSGASRGRRSRARRASLGDLDRAEEAVQDAFVVALERWPRDGVPANPAAWIRRSRAATAIDRLRGERRSRDAERSLERLARRRRAPRRRRAEPDPGRAAAADLHLLPSGARARRRAWR